MPLELLIHRLEKYRSSLLLYRSRFGWDSAKVEARRIEEALAYLTQMKRLDQYKPLGGIPCH